MALGPLSFELREADVMAEGPGTVGVGGGIGAAVVLLGGSSGILYPMPSDPLVGGSARTQYAKVFDLNVHPSTTATGYGIYLAGALPDISTAALFTFDSDTPADNGKWIKVCSFTDTGFSITEEVEVVSGVASTSTPMKGAVRVTIHSGEGGGIVPLVGALSVAHGGMEVGEIPAGGSCASNEIDIALESVLDGSQTIANALNPPSGVTFSRPRTEASRLLAGGDGVLPAGSAQGVWIRWTVRPGMPSSPHLEVYLMGYTPD